MDRKNFPKGQPVELPERLLGFRTTTILATQSVARTCVDYHHLNAAIKRERLMAPTVDEILGQVRGDKYFTIIDCEVGIFK